MADNGVDWNILAERFFRLGELDSADAEALNKAGVSTGLVSSWLGARADLHEEELQAQAQGQGEEVKELSDSDKVLLANRYGGADKVRQLSTWATKHYPPERIQAYNAVAATGNRTAIEFMLDKLKADYQGSLNTEGTRVQGKAVSTEGVLRTSAEIQKAMRDPRYRNDPAYKESVRRRIVAN